MFWVLLYNKVGTSINTNIGVAHKAKETLPTVNYKATIELVMSTVHKTEYLF